MDRRAVAATALLVWAGALQAHMWYVTSTEDFKQSSIAKAGARTDWSVSLPNVFGSSGGKGAGDADSD